VRKKRHQSLQQETYKSQKHPSCDNLKIAQLKRRKLCVKDEIRAPSTVVDQSRRTAPPRAKGKRSLADPTIIFSGGSRRLRQAPLPSGATAHVYK
jgi:hypothetical protein